MEIKKNPELKEEEKEIRKLWDKACLSICNCDWKSYSTIWDKGPGIHLLHPDKKEWLTGWEQVGSYYKEYFDAGVKCELLKNELKLNISPSGEMAWGIVDLGLRYQEIDMTVHLWETVVFEKKMGAWKLVMGLAAKIE